MSTLLKIEDLSVTYRTDGGEIWLDVPAGRKSDVILRLEQCDIKVIDFEVESDRGFLGARR